MKDLSRNVKMLCPICGNDQFAALDSSFDDLHDAPDDTRLKCSDCGCVLTKAKLIESNQEAINATIEEVKKDAVKEFEKELKKALKKWK